jgi:hypothetical protein
MTSLLIVRHTKYLVNKDAKKLPIVLTGILLAVVCHFHSAIFEDFVGGISSISVQKRGCDDGYSKR